MPITWPIGWYVLQEWLSEFNYQITLLPWFTIVITIAILATIALT